MIKKILIVGGANGIGLSIAQELAKRDTTEKVYIVDKAQLQKRYTHHKIISYQFDLTSDDYCFFDQFADIDGLMITAGFGRLALFKDVTEQHIIDSFNVNTIPVLRLIKRFYGKLEGNTDFYCGVMDSIAGWMSSPFFAVYGATKAALKIFIESVNVELKKSGSKNIILNVSPGTIKGSAFYGAENDLQILRGLTIDIIQQLESKKDLYIPQYDETFKEVLQRYYDDFRKEGEHSYEYKLKSSRL
ncbi:MAG: SDR family oxidoreductase [Bacteroidaceae bacterium]|nr:SDR family oxidoreductase [Bacteroidaceae bacterium]